MLFQELNISRCRTSGWKNERLVDFCTYDWREDKSNFAGPYRKKNNIFPIIYVRFEIIGRYFELIIFLLKEREYIIYSIIGVSFKQRTRGKRNSKWYVTHKWVAQFMGGKNAGVTLRDICYDVHLQVVVQGTINSYDQC